MTPWNSGMMEQWNIGSEQGTYLFLKNAFRLLPNIPPFQYSIIPFLGSATRNP